MNKKGVTLIELIVVLVIIAVGATLMVPSIGAWLPRYRLKSATRDIVSTMRTAQMKAITNRMDYQVDFTVGTNSYVLRPNSGTPGPTQSAPSGITINIGGLPEGKATFYRDSRCKNSGDIVLSYQKGGVIQDQKTIHLNSATGRVTIQ